MPFPRRSWPPEHVAEARRLHAEGWNVHQLCQHFRCGSPTLKRMFEEHGIPRRPQGMRLPKTATAPNVESEREAREKRRAAWLGLPTADA